VETWRRKIRKAHFPPKMERVHSKIHATSMSVIIKVFACRPVFALTEVMSLEAVRMTICDVPKDRENICKSNIFVVSLLTVRNYICASSQDSDYTQDLGVICPRLYFYS
jgi:hypothetical protein